MARKKESGPKLSFETCGSCGGTHDNIEVAALSHPKSPWTHYYICPKSSDPCMVSIVQRGDSFEEINRKIVESIIEGESRGSFVAAIFFVKNGEMQLHRHAFNFDINRGADQCAQMLAANMKQDGKAPERANLRAALPPKSDPIFSQVIEGEAKPSS